jgi:hypothetical protein
MSPRPCRACEAVFEPRRWWQEICPTCGPAGRAAYWRERHRKDQEVTIMRRALERLLARKERQADG